MTKKEQLLQQYSDYLRMRNYSESTYKACAILFKFKASKDSETWSHHATLFKVKVDFDKVVF